MTSCIQFSIESIEFTRSISDQKRRVCNHHLIDWPLQLSRISHGQYWLFPSSPLLNTGLLSGLLTVQTIGQQCINSNYGPSESCSTLALLMPEHFLISHTHDCASSAWLCSKGCFDRVYLKGHFHQAPLDIQGIPSRIFRCKNVSVIFRGSRKAGCWLAVVILQVIISQSH